MFLNMLSYATATVLLVFGGTVLHTATPGSCFDLVETDGDNVTGQYKDQDMPHNVSLDDVNTMFDKLKEQTGIDDPMEMMLGMVMDGKGGGDADDKICSKDDRIILYSEVKCQGPKIGSFGSSLKVTAGEEKACEAVDLSEKDCIQADKVKSLLILPGILKVDDSIVNCANADCANDDGFEIKIIKEVRLPQAYCVEEFDTEYKDSHVITTRKGDKQENGPLTMKVCV